MSFKIQEISQYRTELMGVATLLVILGHSAANGVVMPAWMESLCGLASVGVDIFLLVSGLGLWYSLRKSDLIDRGGVFAWYRRRYARVLVPYMLISLVANVLAISRGSQTITTAILDITTINYWLNHRGAWFIAMLIPLYAITPLHDYICRKVKNPLLFNLFVICLFVVISCIPNTIDNIALHRLIDNVLFVIFHLPAFFVGFMIAPLAKIDKEVSWIWMSVVPITVVILLKILGIGYWPGFLFLPFTGILCIVFRYCGRIVMGIFNFFGNISLESYLMNGAVGPWIIAYLPMVYESSINKGNYLHYGLVMILGTLLAYGVHLLCDKLYFKRAKVK